MSRQAGKRELLESLRRDLSCFESPRAQAPSLSLGAPEVDQRLSGGAGLSLAGLHEVVGAAYPDMAAATGFAIALGSRLVMRETRSLVWVTQRSGVHDLGPLYGPGLAMMGLDPARVLIVSAKDDREALWVTEEALRTPDLCGVVSELEGSRAYDLKASRRLQLAAERFERPALLLAGHAGSAASAPSAALTRFRIASAASSPNSSPNPSVVSAPGRARFAVTLDRVRGGSSSQFILEWNHAAHCFSVASPFFRREDGTAGRDAAKRDRPPARPQEHASVSRLAVSA
ncbi:ImuA family protein [Candidatus Phaeomarinobacter ectocarpi]|uniref:ImuA family protein n=1 Tax=Candidatus Phaeomarinibacter ectocarpi TaxID=1458461 RepID=UPI0011AE6546|nr:hypothetical protein [Candidatus Phaeomarinobacter ectocarpi]